VSMLCREVTKSREDEVSDEIEHPDRGEE
jgi:hypothetical protein